MLSYEILLEIQSVTTQGKVETNTQKRKNSKQHKSINLTKSFSSPAFDLVTAQICGTLYLELTF